jgi:flagellar basal body-associated protein FliL
MKIIVLVVILLAAGGGYKFALAKPSAPAPKPKIEGTVYVLGKQFLVNLKNGRFAQFTAALVLDPKDHSTAAGGHGATAKPPEGFGPMAQEGVVRAVITDEVTDLADEDLIDREHRAEVTEHIVKALKKKTDVHVEEVVFTDLTIQ